MTPILSATFAPPSTPTSGRAGARRTDSSIVISRSNSRPAAERATWSATPTVEAFARWALPKASLTYASASAPSRAASAGSLSVSPASKRMFSSMTTSPSGMCSRSGRTRPPRRATRRAATRPAAATATARARAAGRGGRRAAPARRARAARRSRQRQTQAGVVGDLANGAHRHVELGAQQDAGAGEVAEVIERPQAPRTACVTSRVATHAPPSRSQAAAAQESNAAEVPCLPRTMETTRATPALASEVALISAQRGPRNRARIHWEFMRREAFARWPLHGTLEALRDGRLQIGAHTLFEPDVWITIGEDATVSIGEGTFLNIAVMVAAHERVETDRTACSPTGSRDRRQPPLRRSRQARPVAGLQLEGADTYGDDVWLGANVVVRAA